LKDSVELLIDYGVGPEDVVSDTAGNLYTGFLDGRLVKFPANHPDSVSVLASTSRPLGLDVDSQGRLVFADAYQGLMRLDGQRSADPETLTSRAGDHPFSFTNDLAVADDGIIYFTDSSYRYGVDQFEKILMSHAGTGRLLRYNPQTDRTRVLDRNLQFPNGVSISPNGQSLLLVETGRYRVLKYPLNDDGTLGEPDIFIENLPGIPDNINTTDNGYWLAMPTPRNALLDFMGPYPFLRKIVARLPSFVHPSAVRHPIVLKLNKAGGVVRNLQDVSGTVAKISSAYPYEGHLYLGSYAEPLLRRYELRHKRVIR
jgi:sugar lactone lactonase YvrE